MKIKALIWFLLVLLASVYQSKAQILADTVCAGIGGEVYRVKPNPGSRYYWFVQCGAVTSPQPADSAVIDWCGKPGIYRLAVVEITKYGCPGDTVTALVQVINALKVSIAGPQVICKGELIRLQAQGANKYRWSNGETGSAIFVKPDDTTTYSVIGYDGKCTADSVALTINVLPRPTARFSFLPLMPAVDERVVFQYEGKGADEWDWYLEQGRTITGRVQNPEHIFRQPGKKNVMLVTRNKAGCTDTARFTLQVNLDSKIFVPTVFSPNGDGLNDVFRPILMGMEQLNLKIYNRWGELLMEQSGLDAGWDGTFHGETVQEGSYLYMISARDDGKNWHYLEGTITVVR